MRKYLISKAKWLWLTNARLSFAKEFKENLIRNQLDSKTDVALVERCKPAFGLGTRATPNAKIVDFQRQVALAERCKAPLAQECKQNLIRKYLVSKAKWAAQ